ncbi:hypothetical protein KL866_15460 [Alteromonas sp. ALT199]|uniref:hypothetical protein n=1 Tax=unclassified Alteromonas TaxID=2614992 RepID=UPI001BE66DF1|nr:hypothetical protein [Alteromonas sp. ALT199]MBT3136472.1 hypothetical protein [Alteromonas sp. ALT199]
MKPRIYLHAGMHKTGTSAIQKWAKNNRETLENHGLYYPDYEPFAEMRINGHMQFTHAIAGKDSQLTFDECVKLSSKWYDDTLQKNCDVFFSAESIFRHFIKSKETDPRKLYLQRIKELFKGFEVIPVLVFRRPDSFIESLYKETVAKPAPQLPNLIDWAKTKFHLKYTENLLRYKEVFGSVIVLTYENLRDSDNFVQKFFTQMGFSIEANFDEEKVRQSLTVSQIIVKNYANKYISNRSENEHFKHWLKINKELIHASFDGGHASLWDSPEKKSAFLENFPLEEFYNVADIVSDKKKFPPTKQVIENFVTTIPEVLARRVDEFFSKGDSQQGY